MQGPRPEGPPVGGTSRGLHPRLPPRCRRSGSPEREAMVVWCAAPPCQDFSRIVQGAGHQGDRGRLFEESVAFMDELRAALKSHRFAFLYENVEMSAEAAKVSSAALGVQPVFVCPSDFGWVSRPRLWWLSIDWTRLVSDPDDNSPREEGPVGSPSAGRGPGLWAAWRFTRLWPRGESSCLAPRRRRRPTTGGPSRGRPEDGPLETQTPGGWRAVASSPHGTTPWRPCSRMPRVSFTSRRRR